MADRLTASFGSWSFILIQTAVVATWIVVNVVAWRGGMGSSVEMALDRLANDVFETEPAAVS